MLQNNGCEQQRIRFPFCDISLKNRLCKTISLCNLGFSACGIYSGCNAIVSLSKLMVDLLGSKEESQTNQSQIKQIAKLKDLWPAEVVWKRWMICHHISWYFLKRFFLKATTRLSRHFPFR